MARVWRKSGFDYDQFLAIILAKKNVRIIILYFLVILFIESDAMLTITYRVGASSGPAFFSAFLGRGKEGRWIYWVSFI